MTIIILVDMNLSPDWVVLLEDAGWSDRMGDIVLATLKQHETELKDSAVVVVDESRNRIRILPI